MRHTGWYRPTLSVSVIRHLTHSFLGRGPELVPVNLKFLKGKWWSQGISWLPKFPLTGIAAMLLFSCGPGWLLDDRVCRI